MPHRHKLEKLLHSQDTRDCGADMATAEAYARAIADIEGSIVVVSDLRQGTSRIFAGDFASVFSLDDYRVEQSIWESAILSLMPEEVRDFKYISELCFFHFVRKQPAQKRRQFHMASRLAMTDRRGALVEVLHKLHYIYDDTSENMLYAICTYSPATLPFGGKCGAVNSVSGRYTELSPADGNNILSRRERQILSMVKSGKTSAEIADELFISIHTVSRHRQDILARLNVRNSHEAARLATAMGLI